ncbi:hypothetical protein NL676_022890 [Syzygium grande]|nr:hypothetical protein NL676_022890 [Syzygium grande]
MRLKIPDLVSIPEMLFCGVFLSSLDMSKWSEVTDVFCRFTDVVGTDEIGELKQIYLWLSLGNKLSAGLLVEEGLQARFKPVYPDVEVQPASPPRASVMEVDLAAAHMRSPFAAADPKSAFAQFSEPTISGAMGVDIVS